ncbi:hypothetical protein [Chitinophaga sp. CF118]|uniref:hypothetical protein n=1 Tax=Chitinophaga sp. CF118 TaxID=1884367 RepID=UPI000B7F9252|nr:hypothetical protein [Chitinophaga sp. CF118]
MEVGNTGGAAQPMTQSALQLLQTAASHYNKGMHNMSPLNGFRELSSVVLPTKGVIIMRP